MSPSGTSIAFANDRAGTFAIYVAPLAGGVARAITSGSVGGDFQPRWAPSGQDVLFLRDVGANDNDLYTVSATGANLRRLTNTPTRAEFSATWSPTGQEIVFFTGEGHLYSIRSDGSGESQLAPVPQAPFVETFGRNGPIDASMFHTIANPGGSILASGGRLLASVFHDADPSTQNFNQIDEHIGTQCTLNGDFDIQVDYSLVTWPPHGGFFAMLNGIFADGAVARVSTQFDPPYDEGYNGWSSGPPFTFGQVNTADQSGQMRLVRQAGVLYEYERNGPSASWTLVHTGGLRPGTRSPLSGSGPRATPGLTWTAPSPTTTSASTPAASHARTGGATRGPTGLVPGRTAELWCGCPRQEFVEFVHGGSTQVGSFDHPGITFPDGVYVEKNAGTVVDMVEISS